MIDSEIRVTQRRVIRQLAPGKVPGGCGAPAINGRVVLVEMHDIGLAAPCRHSSLPILSARTWITARSDTRKRAICVAASGHCCVTPVNQRGKTLRSHFRRCIDRAVGARLSSLALPVFSGNRATRRTVATTAPRCRCSSIVVPGDPTGPVVWPGQHRRRREPLALREVARLLNTPGNGVAPVRAQCHGGRCDN